MLQLFRGEAADAIATATEALDAAIEDAQAQRDALQAQYDALQKQISALWTQADEICSQMYELDQTIGDAAGEIGGTGVTVQVYSRGLSRLKGANTLDDNREAISKIQDLRKQLDGVDSQAARIEQAYDPNEDLPDEENRAYNDLYEQAKDLWRQISDVVDEYELAGESYFDTSEFESNLVADAAFNY